MERTVSFVEVIRATFALIRSDLLLVLGVGIVAAVVGTSLDFTAPAASNAMNLLMIVVQYSVVKRQIERQGLRSADKPGGFGSFFLLGILSGLAILLGFVLLIIPGIYLYARWSMADAALVAENCGATGAMERSWAASRASAVPIALASAVIGLPTALAMAAFFASGAVEGAGIVSPGSLSDIALAAVGNLLIYIGQLAGLYMCVALYSLLI